MNLESAKFDAVDVDAAKELNFSPNNVGFDGVIEVNLGHTVVTWTLNSISGRREH